MAKFVAHFPCFCVFSNSVPAFINWALAWSFPDGSNVFSFFALVVSSASFVFAFYFNFFPTCLSERSIDWDLNLKNIESALLS